MEKPAGVVRAYLLGAIFLFFSIPCLRCHADGARSLHQFTGTTMGVVKYHATVVPWPQTGVSKKFNPLSTEKAVAQTLSGVNDSMSTYIADSDVSKFNRSQSTDWIPVDLETALVVQRALEISQQTDGAFDITVGPLVDLWGFGPGGENAPNSWQPPSEKQIAAVLQHVGYEKLLVRTEPPALKKSIPNVQIDLSAIAKGYAVDAVVRTLQELGCKSAFVEVGGEVRAFGTKPDGQPWRVGVNDPTSLASDSQIAAVDLRDTAMATSGNYRNFHISGGKAYGHSLDPQTGRAANNSIASATIIADDCMTADALATAAMVLGQERAKAVCLKLQAQALLYSIPDEKFDRTRGRMDVDSSELIVHQTNGFPLASPPAPPSRFWPIIVATSLAFGLAVLAMSVGVIVSNRRIKGSCGGIASLQESQGESVACSMCSNPSDQCKELREAVERKMGEPQEVQKH